MKFKLSEPGIVVSAGLHVFALLLLLVSFTKPEQFDPMQETVPIETVSESEFNQVMQGDKSATEVKQDAALPKTAETEPQPQATPTPPEPPQPQTPPPPPPPPEPVQPPTPPTPPTPPPPEPPTVTPPERPQNTPSPPTPPERPVDAQPIPTPPEKPVEAAAEPIAPKPIPTPPRPPERVVESKPLPTPPPRPKLPKPPPPKPAPPKPDQLAKLLEAQPQPTPVAKPQPKPHPRPVPQQQQPAQDATADHAFDPTDISKLLSQAAPAQRAASGQSQTRVASLGSPTAHAAKMAPSLWGQLDGLMEEQYRQCWSYLGLTTGQKYIPQIRVMYDENGALTEDPVLVNPPGDPSLRSLAESAIRAVRRCNPLRIPPQYAPFYDEWKGRVLRFDPQEMAG